MRYELTLAIEDKSLNKRVTVKKSEIEDGRSLYFLTFFQSIGVVYPLTCLGHIEVTRSFCCIYYF